jgi:hypothetical protein
LQHALPSARILYVSATGATTVHNLAYAQRLGLWGGADFPFATRAEFVEAIEAGGVAAMEVLARDLKALGLYAARSLSFEGIEYELVEHQLTSEQVRIYDAYAAAFQVIHNNLNAALQAANVMGETGTLNSQAKSAARSAFESAKQRFFNHLITAMKTPALIAAVDRDLESGHAAVIQIVSTGEALMERRLSEIPTEEWGDVQVDITPREYVLDYLAHGFPTQLFEPFTDSEGNLSSRPVYRDGQPVQCHEAIERRDRMIERLASLPPVQGALDQIVQRFGTDLVAEVTGRSRRIVRKRASGGLDRLAVEARAGSANLAEAQAFMDDEKRILVFSDAGGTGRSYHADLAAKNSRLRVHYLLEAGWRADSAIQGLGRSNRTNQAQPPLFRPIATDVKAEKRFLSTIARRLDTLGAITKGQRQTGGQGLFRADDNLESIYARAALRQLYLLLYTGKVEGCSLQAFEDATGLRLTDGDGSLREGLPPITTFLNRLLALTIGMQNTLFGVFEDLQRAKVEGAIASGTYDIGVETIIAESLVVTDRRTLYTHPQSGAETSVFTITRRDRNRPFTLAEALERAGDRHARLLVNAQSGRAAVQVSAPSLMLDDGTVERRIRLLRPDGAPRDFAWRFGAHTLGGTRSRRFRPRVGGRDCFGARVHRQQHPHRHRPAAADLETAPERLHARLSAADRRWRAHHRPLGLAGLGRAGDRERRAVAQPRRRVRCHARRTRGPAALRRARAPSRQSHERIPHRALGLHRRDGRSIESDRPDLRDHLMEVAPVRADWFVWTEHPGEADGTAPARPHHRQGGCVSDMASQAAELARRLARDAEAVCRNYLSNGRRRGRYWVVGDVANTPGRSLFVRLTGPDSGKGAAGKWTDAATGQHGDLLPHRPEPPVGAFARRARRGSMLPQPTTTRTAG